MTKWKQTGLMAFLIVGGLGALIWVIRDEGARNRQAMQDAGTRVEDGVREKIASIPEDTVEHVGDMPGDIIDRIQDRILGADDEDESTGSNGPDKKKDDGGLVAGIFRLGQEAARAADQLGQEVLRLSPSEQQQLGDALAESIRRERRVLEDPRAVARLNRLAEPFLDDRANRVTWTLLDSDTVNAFSLIGGHVFVNRGLLELLSSDDELQFVVGHELAHLELGHCARVVTYAARASSVGGEVAGTMANVIYAAVAAGYSEQQEFAADAWAYRNMRDHGKTADQAQAATRRMIQIERDQKPPGSPSPDKSDDVGSVVREIDQHFRTHPSGKDRLAQLADIEQRRQ